MWLCLAVVFLIFVNFENWWSLCMYNSPWNCANIVYVFIPLLSDLAASTCSFLLRRRYLNLRRRKKRPWRSSDGRREDEEPHSNQRGLSNRFKINYPIVHQIIYGSKLCCTMNYFFFSLTCFVTCVCDDKVNITKSKYYKIFASFSQYSTQLSCVQCNLNTIVSKVTLFLTFEWAPVI